MHGLAMRGMFAKEGRACCIYKETTFLIYSKALEREREINISFLKELIIFSN